MAEENRTKVYMTLEGTHNTLVDNFNDLLEKYTALDDTWTKKYATLEGPHSTRDDT